MPASNMTLDELPYFAQDAVLPEPLPTRSAIRSSADVLSDWSTHRVVGVGIHFIVKYGTGVDLMEGQNMLFVRQATTVPVPQVYAMFRETESGENYIVMERIQGRSLDHEWSLLCQREKHAVASKIKRGFEELRKLPSPGGFCSLGTRPLSDDIFGTDSGSASLAGPFATESALNEAILRTLLRAQISIHKVNFYRRAFSNVFCKHPPTYTHGNFQRSKVVIQRPWNTSNCDAVNAKRLDIHIHFLGWKRAGWYPCYWEYARSLFIGGAWDDGWNNYIEEMMQPFHVEWSWTEKVLTDLWT